MSINGLPSARAFGVRAGMTFTLLYPVCVAAMRWPGPLHLGTRGIPSPDFIGRGWVLEQNLQNWTTPGVGIVSRNAFWQTDPDGPVEAVAPDWPPKLYPRASSWRTVTK